MDAQIFSHTVDNLGFSPKHLQPPAYIKVRSKFKKDRQFDRVFLAQELRTRGEKKRHSSGGAPANPQSGVAGVQNPVWATEFSKDGRYLAAGGQDRVLRVWAVISTPEERRAHENDEHSTGSSGVSTRLSAPVFQQKPYREYQGHESTILDLSWSKVSFEDYARLQVHDADLSRTIFCCLHPWTRPLGSGTLVETRTFAYSSTLTSYHPLNSILKMTAFFLLDPWIQNCDYGAYLINLSHTLHQSRI